MNSYRTLSVVVMLAVTLSRGSSAAEPLELEYGRVGSHSLKLDLYQPEGHAVQQAGKASSRPAPTVVWVHGGAWRSGSKSRVPILRFLKHGFAIASVDYRLSPVAPFPAQAHDIKAAIRFLRANAGKYQLDPERFVIAGASAGGHLAAIVGVSDGVEELEGKVGEHTDQDSSVQAIVSFYGASNLQSILDQSTAHGLSVRVPALQLLLGGQPKEMPGLAKLASPVAHVDKSDPPLWLIHGDADPQMPPQQSDELEAVYKEKGVPVQLQVVSEGKHGGAGFYEDARLDPLAKDVKTKLETEDNKQANLERPNVLFIAMDDLNDWIGCLGGHPQTITPNLDRLAASGVLFTNAHCPAPACNPCRSAIFTGRAPNRSGLYDNRQQMREVMPDEVLIPKYFHQHGYYSAGSGKLLHYFIDAQSWDDYFPEPASENPLPYTFYPEKRPVNLPRGGPWQYIETDWAPLDVTDEEFGGDWSVSKWIGEKLSKRHEKPFFLGCGIYRPHEPWFVPQKYFKPFPLKDIQLPPGYKEGDLDDVPAIGVRGARNRYFAHIQKHGQWKQGIQGYLASIYFADAMLGRVIESLEAGPNAKNTVVMLWSDHGWQLGEKEHWQKYTPWRGVTRIPLIVRVPPSVSAALPAGTPANTTCDLPANLLSLYPTLLQLCGLPARTSNDGPSLVPLLKDPKNAAWPHASVTYLSKPGSYAVSGRTHRYIHYADGSEELYDIDSDPYEWNNLAKQDSFASRIAEFRSRAPKEFAARVEPSVESLTKLKWQLLKTDNPPPSKPDGNPFPVFFSNQRDATVELCWIDRSGTPKSYGEIASGQRKRQQTRPGAVWMIRDSATQETLGYFVVDDRTAQAIVPERE